MRSLIFLAITCITLPISAQSHRVDATSLPGDDASVKINACIAAVVHAGGGVCDASGFTGVQRMSQQINLGSTSQVAAKVGVSLLLPDSAVWTWDLRDGTSCGIRQYSSTSLIGNQPGGGGDRMGLTARGTAKMDSIYCTDDNPAGVYVRAEGFSAFNNQDAVFTNGVVHIRNVVDESSFTRIYGGNYNGDGWHIDSACCGAKFDDIQGVSNGNLHQTKAGGVPLTIGSHKENVRSIAFYNSTFNQPGQGLPDIHMIGGGRTLGVAFFNVYMEGNGATDSKTPMVLIDALNGPVHFYGGSANAESPKVNGAVSDTKPVFENHGVSLTLDGFEITNTATAVIDATAKTKINTFLWNDNLGTVDSYRTVVAPGVRTR